MFPEIYRSYNIAFVIKLWEIENFVMKYKNIFDPDKLMMRRMRQEEEEEKKKKRRRRKRRRRNIVYKETFRN